MKSPMLKNLDVDDPGNYTELMVLHSPAGYYVGTMYNDPAGFQEPGSRDSEYFRTQKEADTFLKLVESDCQAALRRLRMHP